MNYCSEQKHICMLNSRIEDNIKHHDIDAEVRALIADELNHSLIQQSSIDVIRNLKISSEHGMT